MPKASAVLVKGTKPQKIQRKFKLGNRKTAVSATSMTTAELIDRLENGNLSGRYKQKIRTVLDTRIMPLSAEDEAGIAAQIAADSAAEDGSVTVLAV